ncbi:MAG: UbiA family prenyltransferase [Deltaproteobacteria bacterium]|nr:UbiA family prenyltransferase [Deltaproteobacteria bacterium]
MSTPLTESSALAAKPLCVDLDGTLVATDVTVEGIVQLLKAAPWRLLSLLIVLMRGRPALKRYVARHVSIDASTLPYRSQVLGQIRQARAAGRRVLLVTASDQTVADAVGAHLGLVDEVVGTHTDKNLKGLHKAEYLVSRFGSGGFQYIGDSSADLPVWRAAGEALMVAPSVSTQRRAEQSVPRVEVLVARPNKLRAAFKELRPHQWAKNVLLFVPLYFAHQYTNLELVFAAVMAFFSFSFAASSIYVLNDLVDLPADRSHRSKRSRPLAAGSLSIVDGILLSLVALGVSIALAILFVHPGFVLVVLGYVALTTAYSFYLKQQMIVDVLTLASLFTYRVMAGGVAVDVPLSEWLLAFSIFFFMSLAFVKRYSELIQTKADGRMSIEGRNYVPADMPIIIAAGLASGFLAVLVFALYINTPAITAYYPRVEVLWGVCLVLVYWIMRIWFLAARDQMHDDPVLFALKDRISIFAGVVVIACLFAARYS